MHHGDKYTLSQKSSKPQVLRRYVQNSLINLQKVQFQG